MLNFLVVLVIVSFKIVCTGYKYNVVRQLSINQTKVKFQE